MAQYQNILVATDFSDQAGRAVEAAKELAAHFDARVCLLHVVDPARYARDLLPGTFTEVERRLAVAASERLEELAKEKFAGLTVDVAAVTGEAIAATIAEEAKERKADLCMVGTHGRTGINRMLIGSVAEAVVRLAPCDVLTVPSVRQDPAIPRRIMVATDFSEQAERALARAGALTQSFGSELTLLHVHDPRVPVVPMGVPAIDEPQLRNWAREQLAKLASERLEDDARVRSELLVEPSAPDAICRHAEESATELLVLGTHGRRGVTRLLIGSVAERVVRHAHCPVLVVREPKP
jgi:nucleotide-binding universal stress UspA family protein